MANWTIDRTADLNNIGSVATGLARGYVNENNAHVWNVTVMQSGVAVDLTGYTATANIRRADGTIVRPGTISGNVVSVAFPQAAYAYAGILYATLRLVNVATDVEIVVDALQMAVTDDGAGAVIDPGDVVPSVAELLAQIADMEAATVAANDIVGTGALRLDAMQAQLDVLVVEGDSSVEAAQARIDYIGTTHATLKARIDAKEVHAVSIRDFAGASDTAKLQALVDFVTTYCETNELGILIPSGSYTITSDIVITGWENKVIDCLGKLTFSGCNALAFVRAKNCKMRFASIYGGSVVSSGDLASLAYNGIKLTNCETCHVEVARAYYLANAILMHGQDFEDGYGRGTYGNEIVLRRVYFCKDAIRLTAANEGWVNENTVRGGACWTMNGVVQGEDLVTPDQAPYTFQHNRFLWMEFEHMYGGSAVLLYQGRNCVIESPRFEQFADPDILYHIYEGDSACLNRYSTAFYMIDSEKIHLSTYGLCGSEVIGDIRNNDTQATQVARRMWSIPDASNPSSGTGIIAYEALGPKSVSLANSIAMLPSSGVMMWHKDADGNAENVLTYSPVEYVQDADFSNSYANFSNTTGSTYPRMHYYKAGQDELVIGGYIKKATTPTDGETVYTLPTGYRALVKSRHALACESDGGTKGLAIVEVDASAIKFIGYASGSGALSRLAFGNLRIKLNLPTTA